MDSRRSLRRGSPFVPVLAIAIVGTSGHARAQGSPITGNPSAIDVNRPGGRLSPRGYDASRAHRARAQGAAGLRSANVAVASRAEGKHGGIIAHD
jgi:hypothetical protein